jgi:hypothetical protein
MSAKLTHRNIYIHAVFSHVLFPDAPRVSQRRQFAVLVMARLLSGFDGIGASALAKDRLSFHLWDLCGKSVSQSGTLVKWGQIFQSGD